MPSYENFLKEILANKIRLVEYEMMKLNEECSVIKQNKLPPKLKDLGSIMIICNIDSFFDKILYNLGVSINIMPYSIFAKLGLGEVKATIVSLQLAGISIRYPWSMVEDILVKVDKFIFLSNFLVFNMDEDGNIPIILGRPFLATGKALINV